MNHKKQSTPPRLLIGGRAGILVTAHGAVRLTPEQSSRLGLSPVAHDLLLVVHADERRPASLVASGLGVVELVQSIRPIEEGEVVNISHSLFPWAVTGWPADWPPRPALHALVPPAERSDR